MSATTAWRRAAVLAGAALFLLPGGFLRPAQAGEVVILGRKGQVGRPGPHGGDYRQAGERRLECLLAPGRTRMLFYLADGADQPLPAAGVEATMFRPAGEGTPRLPPVPLQPAPVAAGDPWAEAGRLEADLGGAASGRLVLHIVLGGTRYDIAYDPARLPVAAADGAVPSPTAAPTAAATPTAEASSGPGPSPSASPPQTPAPSAPPPSPGGG